MFKLFIINLLLLTAATLANGPVNSGFEAGLTNWNLQEGSAVVSVDGYQGDNACLLSCTTEQVQGLLTSKSFDVTADREYRLNAFQKMASGSGNYMVAIAWLQSSGDLIYHDNAWTGINKPAEYTLHTGLFTAPAGAAKCVLMLGATTGTSYLFDDIELVDEDPIPDQPDFLELDNGTLRIRMNIKEYGGAITYLSLSDSDRNIINTHDRGREIQQSYYAGQSLDRIADGQHPAWSPWPWNPIQVGDAFGNSSTVIESNITDGVAYTKTIPLLWDMNNEPGQCYMEQWTTLRGANVHVRCKLTCFRTDSTWTLVRNAHQELPAVYTIGDLFKLYTYVGSNPWQGGALTEIENNGPPWEYWTTTEKWAAAVDASGWGLGVYNENATLFVGGLHGSGSGGTSDGSTNYISPLTTERLGKTSVFEYEYELYVGDIDEIRDFVYMKNSGADVDDDGDVDLADFAEFAAAWQSDSSDANWNAKCNIAAAINNVIDTNDLAVLLNYWIK